jgi:hypothetical protein
VGDDYRAREIRVLSLARQLLAGQLNVIAAARALAPFGHDAQPELREILLVFAGINSETDDLPVGEVRQRWSAEALERKDREIAKAEEFYRDRAMEAATRLVRLLEFLQ